MSEVTINGKAYAAKYSLRALFMYERLSGNNGFETKSTEDTFRFMFAMVKANNPDCDLTWDAFLDACEEDPTVPATLSGILTAQVSESAEMADKTAHADNDEAKKK